MNPRLAELKRSQRAFFGFIAKRAALGTVLSLAFAAGLLWSDVGGIKTLMSRAGEPWLWGAIFCFDIWVTVTGITIAIGIWNLGEWRDPPG